MESFILSYCTNVLDLNENLAQEQYKRLARHKDILQEFINWLKDGRYVSENAVSVEGYTAERLHKEFGFLVPIGIFNYLIYLREDPKGALEGIKNGLPRK